MRHIHLAVLTLITSAAHAQWAITNLHPAGATASSANAIGPSPGGIQEGGAVTIANASHAALWSGSAASFVDLHPNGATSSGVYGVSAGQQVGAATVFNTTLPTAWSGTAASTQFLSTLDPGVAYCVSNGMIGGDYTSGSAVIACHWIGTTRTVDNGGSVVLGVDNPNRVGWVRTGSFPFYGSNALIWIGSSTSSTSLHPAGAYNSSATAVGGNQQVGRVSLSQFGQNHAALWTGSAASFVDLHPSPATASECLAVSNGVQVGDVMLIDPNDPNMNSISRAALWTGTAASFVNLHSFLPSNYYYSTAYGVYHAGGAGGTTYVVGSAYNTTTSRTEAVMWTSVPPPPPCGSADFDCDGDTATDADIESFFRCLAGTCPPPPCTSSADFNRDGDSATDADIEAFFRVLAGGHC
jgi:hypothetical protein